MSLSAGLKYYRHITVKHTYNEQAYNELTLTVTGFPPLAYKQIVELTDITNTVYTEYCL